MALAMIGGGGALAGCGADAGSGPGVRANFWRLALNYEAITMSTAAPYDTVRIVATPLDASSAPLTGAALDSVMTTYTIANPRDTNVTVSASGLVRAWHPDGRAVIRVRTSVGGVTHTDSVLVRVTDVQDPPRLATLRLSLAPSDTLYYNDYSRQWPTPVVEALDANGNVIPDVVFSLRTSEPRVAQAFESFGVIPEGWPKAGPVMVYVTSTVYGVTRRDSVVVHITQSFTETVNIAFRTPHGSTTPVGYFDPPVDTVAAGAVISWVVLQEDPETIPPPIDIVFDDPSKVAAFSAVSNPYGFDLCDPEPGVGGNVAAFKIDYSTPCGDSYRLRSFPYPGTYRYHSGLYGSKGTIIVLPP